MDKLPPDICRRVAGLGQLSRALGEERAEQIGLAVAHSLATSIRNGGNLAELLNDWSLRIALEIASQGNCRNSGNVRRLHDVLPEVSA